MTTATDWLASRTSKGVADTLKCREIIVNSVKANRLQSKGDGTFRAQLANNVSSFNAARILAAWDG